MTEAHRTPDDRFEGLPDFPWQPRYLDWDGIRIARIDEGDGEPVVLFHGEPTWSFLYRKVIPPLLAAGHRCIAPDYAGFGRSDKPLDFDWYTFDRHTESMLALLDDLGVRGATFVVQDWGGPIGMRIAAERSELCSRLVVLDTAVSPGTARVSSAWKAFRDFVERTEDLPISMLVGRACKTPPSEEVLAGYDAPYPDPAAKQGARAFPLLIPMSPDAPGAAENRRTLEAMAESDRPVLVLWADSDPILSLKLGRGLSERLGWPEPETIPDASHFLQEDQGELIGRRIAEWLDG
jgi:haloalkane dehalogenase